MSWSKVEPGKKPFGWWYHKVLAEIGYAIYANAKNTWVRVKGLSIYYSHLNAMCKKYKINLYGTKIHYNIKYTL